MLAILSTHTRQSISSFSVSQSSQNTDETSFKDLIKRLVDLRERLA